MDPMTMTAICRTGSDDWYAELLIGRLGDLIRLDLESVHYKAGDSPVRQPICFEAVTSRDDAINAATDVERVAQDYLRMMGIKGYSDGDFGQAVEIWLLMQP